MKPTAIVGIGRLTIVSVVILFSLLLPGVVAGVNIPSVEDVVKGEVAIPSIEDLTGGKVKNDGVIDKSNVELVREYLPAGLYELVKKGMVLNMGTQLPPDQANPKAYKEATDRNRGKAILDKNGVVYYEKIGTLWPGGLPFPWTKNGLELMANHYYGKVWDSFHTYPATICFVNARGEIYKSVVQEHFYVKCVGRTIYPPLGAAPGYDNILIRRVTGMTYPLEVKGLGQYSDRYYDLAKEDTGFAYIPAFKRTIRINASTWQDNSGGSDFTYGDGEGFQEPLTNWNFKLLDKKFILVTEAKSPFPIVESNGEVSKKLKFDMGKKYPRLGWVVCPVDVIECTPRIKHVYGKQLMYMPIWPYAISSGAIMAKDIYDRQLRLWKFYLTTRGKIEYINGDPQKAMTGPYCASMFDLQTDHTSNMWLNLKFEYVNPQDLNLGKLLKMGR